MADGTQTNSALFIVNAGEGKRRGHTRGMNTKPVMLADIFIGFDVIVLAASVWLNIVKR